MLFVLLGLLAGGLRGGRLSGLLDLRGLWMPAVAFLLKLMPQLSPALGALLPLSLCGYTAVLLLFLWRNRALAGAALCALGTLCNFSVMAANGFSMPVSPAALAYYGITAEQVEARMTGYFVAESTALPLYPLCDCLLAPFPVIGGFYSLGDLLLGAGLGYLIYAAMRNGYRAQAPSFTAADTPL